jgi:hypothetical protein
VFKGRSLVVIVAEEPRSTATCCLLCEGVPSSEAHSHQGSLRPREPADIFFGWAPLPLHLSTGRVQSVGRCCGLTSAGHRGPPSRMQSAATFALYRSASPQSQQLRVVQQFVALRRTLAEKVEQRNRPIALAVREAQSPNYRGASTEHRRAQLYSHFRCWQL